MLKNLRPHATKLALIHRSAHNQSTPEILSTKINQIGVITLNRPKQLNALNYNLTSQLNTILDKLNKDSSIEAILIKSSNDIAFCAGGDINQTNDVKDHDQATKYWQSEYMLPYRISELNKPYVSLLNGVTLGMGCGICIHGEYRIATERTLFAMPETAIGFIPDGGFYTFGAGLNDDVSLWMGLTGARIKGKDVRRLGIATHYLNEDGLKGFESELYDARNVKEELKCILDKYDVECEGKFDSSQIHAHFNETSLEKIFHNLEATNSEWSNKQLKILNRMSPTSLLITLRQHAIEQKMTVRQAVEFQYKLGRRIIDINPHDFNVGVKSVLGRNKTVPKWNPSSVRGMSSTDVDVYFEGLEKYEFDFSLD